MLGVWWCGLVCTIIIFDSQLLPQIPHCFGILSFRNSVFFFRKFIECIKGFKVLIIGMLSIFFVF